MLPPRIMVGTGAALVAAGVVTYILTDYQLEAAVVGIALGVSIIALADIGGGPRPIPRGGYAFPEAMAMLRRATFGGVTVATVLTALSFYLWIEGQAGPRDVLIVFALSLLVVYASVLAAGALVLVGHFSHRGEDE